MEGDRDDYDETENVGDTKLIRCEQFAVRYGLFDYKIDE